MRGNSARESHPFTQIVKKPIPRRNCASGVGCVFFFCCGWFGRVELERPVFGALPTFALSMMSVSNSLDSCLGRHRATNAYRNEERESFDSDDFDCSDLHVAP